MRSVVLVVIVSLMFISTLRAGEGQGDLTVILSGFSSDQGKAMLAMADSEENYDARSNAVKPFMSAVVDIDKNKARVALKNVPYGRYAIKVFHDQNSNGELDTNFLGIPTEQYGFSNNARGSFGPPEYEDAAFNFRPGHEIIHITLE